MISGAVLGEIAKTYKFTPRQVERLLRNELRKRWIAPAQDYARLQIARLEAIAVQLKEKCRDGESARHRPPVESAGSAGPLPRFHQIRRADGGRARGRARATIEEARAGGTQAGERHESGGEDAGRAVRRSSRHVSRRARARPRPAQRGRSAELYYDWSLWGRPDQQTPKGDWIYWLILAGRGAGKTRAGAETARPGRVDYRSVNLIGATRQDAREIMVTGESGVLAICPPEERPVFARASDRLEWPNGAISQISPPRSRTGCAASNT